MSQKEELTGRARRLANLKPFQKGDPRINRKGQPTNQLAKALRKKLEIIAPDGLDTAKSADVMADAIIDLAANARKKAQRAEGGRFQKGVSGNPSGRPEGSRLSRKLKEAATTALEEAFLNGWLRMQLKGELFGDGVLQSRIVIDKRKYRVRFVDETDNTVTILFERCHNQKPVQRQNRAPRNIAPKPTLEQTVTDALKGHRRSWDELLAEARKHIRGGCDVEDALGVLLGEMVANNVARMERVGDTRFYSLR